MSTSGSRCLIISSSHWILARAALAKLYADRDHQRWTLLAVFEYLAGRMGLQYEGLRMEPMRRQ